MTLPENFMDHRENRPFYFYWATIVSNSTTLLSLFPGWRQPIVCMCYKYIPNSTYSFFSVPPSWQLAIKFLISLNPPGYFASDKSINSIHVEGIVFSAMFQSLLTIIVCGCCVYSEDRISKYNAYSPLFCSLSDKCRVWLVFLMQKGI